MPLHLFLAHGRRPRGVLVLELALDGALLAQEILARLVGVVGPFVLGEGFECAHGLPHFGGLHPRREPGLAEDARCLRKTEDVDLGDRARQVGAEDGVEKVHQQAAVFLRAQQGLEDAVDLGIDGVAQGRSLGRTRDGDNRRRGAAMGFAALSPSYRA